ncbi:MAG: 50S ribosomal protein L29 [bacterium]|nr:50S ribosomal protein L29 [bacterium]
MAAKTVKSTRKEKVETIADWRQLELGELKAKVAARQKKLQNLRQDLVLQKITDVSQLKKARREIARLETVIREKEFLQKVKA